MKQLISSAFCVLILFLMLPLFVVAQKSTTDSVKTRQEIEGGIWAPRPKEVTPGKVACNNPIPAPSDADILFDGSDLTNGKA